MLHDDELDRALGDAIGTTIATGWTIDRVTQLVDEAYTEVRDELEDARADVEYVRQLTCHVTDALCDERRARVADGSVAAQNRTHQLVLLGFGTDPTAVQGGCALLGVETAVAFAWSHAAVVAARRGDGPVEELANVALPLLERRARLTRGGLRGLTDRLVDVAAGAPARDTVAALLDRPRVRVVERRVRELPALLMRTRTANEAAAPLAAGARR